MRRGSHNFNDWTTVRPIVERVQKDMLEQYNVSCGCWGVPDGAKWTFTRAEFYGKAYEYRLLNLEEFNRIHSYYGLVWQRDLSD